MVIDKTLGFIFSVFYRMDCMSFMKFNSWAVKKVVLCGFSGFPTMAYLTWIIKIIAILSWHKWHKRAYNLMRYVKPRKFTTLKLLFGCGLNDPNILFWNNGLEGLTSSISQTQLKLFPVLWYWISTAKYLNYFKG